MELALVCQFTEPAIPNDLLEASALWHNSTSLEMSLKSINIYRLQRILSMVLLLILNYCQMKQGPPVKGEAWMLSLYLGKVFDFQVMLASLCSSILWSSCQWESQENSLMRLMDCGGEWKGQANHALGSDEGLRIPTWICSFCSLLSYSSQQSHLCLQHIPQHLQGLCTEQGRNGCPMTVNFLVSPAPSLYFSKASRRQSWCRILLYGSLKHLQRQLACSRSSLSTCFV